MGMNIKLLDHSSVCGSSLYDILPILMSQNNRESPWWQLALIQQTLLNRKCVYSVNMEKAACSGMAAKHMNWAGWSGNRSAGWVGMGMVDMCVDTPCILYE